MPQALLEEWKAFDELEPDGQSRTDWGFAHVVQAIMRTNKPLLDFMLPFGDFEKPAAEPQSIATQEKLIDAWIFGSNAILQRGRKG